MALIRLIYESTLISDHEPTLVFALGSGRRNNTHDGITGVTLISGRNILEILEGESEIVRQTFQRLSADQRHKISNILVDESIEQRYFSKWNIGCRHPLQTLHGTGSWADAFYFDGVDNFLVRSHPGAVTDILENFARNR